MKLKYSAVSHSKNTTCAQSGWFNSFNPYICTIDFTFSQAKKRMMLGHLQNALFPQMEQKVHLLFSGFWGPFTSCGGNPSF